MDFDGKEDMTYKKLQKIALEELREDETTKSQSLEQLKEWISKNPKIKKCRTDDTFLLRFLRTKKFSVPLAYEMLERYLIVRQVHANWFKNLDCEDKYLSEIISSGYLAPLPNRINGKLVCFCCIEKLDPYKFTSGQALRAINTMLEVMMDDEINQICGYTFFIDFKNFQMAHFSLWSFNDIRNIFLCIQNSYPMRFKALHYYNMTPLAAKLINFGLTFLSKKLRSRVFVHSSFEDLKNKIDPKYLPKEYGGEVPLSTLAENFKTLVKEKRKFLLSLDEMYIEFDEKENKFVSEINSELDIGMEGSFKTLNVD